MERVTELSLLSPGWASCDDCGEDLAGDEDACYYKDIEEFRCGECRNGGSPRA